jgi:catechol 2,3-dioxygenase-like lactoylglutathione lyase family enzyme
MPRVLGVETVIYSVSDYEQSLRFYGETLGMRKIREEASEGYACFEAGGSRLSIGTDWRPHWTPGSPTVSLLTDDLRGLLAELEKEGVKVLERPRRTAWGQQVAMVADPDGNGIELLQEAEGEP